MRPIKLDVNMNPDDLSFLGELDEGKIAGLSGDDAEETLARLRSPAQQGVTLPWTTTHDKFRIRPGEVTFWAGYNGHGKTGLMGQVMTHLVAEERQRVMVASFEMPLDKLRERHVLQVVGKREFADVTDQEYWNALGPMDGSYWVHTQNEDIDPNRILAWIHHAASTEPYRVNHFVVDSLAMCNIPDGEGYNTRLKEFMLHLQTLAKGHGIHIHLLAHLRKPDRITDRPPSRFDIKYGGELSDMANNVALIWRNEAKERGEGDCPHDSVLIIDKQRNFPSWTGAIPLSYNHDGGSWYE